MISDLHPTQNSSSALETLHKRVSRIITDSRTPVADYSKCAFFALITHTDNGHRYIQHLYDKGVRIFVISEIPADMTSMPDAEFIVVDDVYDALAHSAASVRASVHCPVIGITGSTGKTVFKEMLNAALGQKMRCIRSPRSWNSQIGVPLSLWKLREDTQIGIFEAGISHKGEMSRLRDMIKPVIGVFTALNDEHASGFDSLEDKAHEKALLFTGCRRVYFPAGDTRIEKALNETLTDVELVAVDGSLTDLCYRLAIDLGANPDTARSAIENADSISGRIDLSELTELTSVEYDHYTTDNDGIDTALDFALRRKSHHRRLVAIVGDLFVFPSDCPKAYTELEDTLSAAGVSHLVCVGKTIPEYARKFNSGFEVSFCENINDVYSVLNDNDLADSVIYINTLDKGSSRILRDRMSSLRHITRMNINLEALASNFKYYKSLLPQGIRTVAMIKASAYGCGAVEVARTLQAASVDYFAVAVVDEGTALRAAGVTTPVIVLDPWCTDPRSIALNKLEPTLMAPNINLIQELDRAAADASLDSFNVHIKIDTGMHRLGLNEEQIDEFAHMLASFPRLNPVSVFSHLATADCLDQDEYTQYQLQLFDRMSDRLERALEKYKGTKVKLLRHILNTAGTQRFGKTHHNDMVRIGIGLYGISPLAPNPRLKPVATLATTVIALQSYSKGQTVGYGRKGVLKRDSVIATLPIGYADGINRHLGCGNASFMIGGRYYPTVGNICMDLCMIDVTDCPDITVGTPVEIFGDNAPIERLADTLGTIPYEILTSVSPRVKRVYFRG